jgi:sec-independent protein translocase protein TatA
MFDVGSGELMVILLLALLLFGGKLPEVARNFGRSVGELKRSLAETTRPLRDAQHEVEREMDEVGGETPKPATPGGGGPPPGPRDPDVGRPAQGTGTT